MPISRIIAVENNLANILVEAWQGVFTSYMTRLLITLKAGNPDAARKIVDSFTLDVMLDELHKTLDAYSHMAFKYGTQQVASPSIATNDLHKEALDLFKISITQNVALQVKKSSLKVIDNFNKVKKFESILNEFKSFADNVTNAAERNLRMATQLHTSRLAAYGATAEMTVLGIKEYSINGQLDRRLCYSDDTRVMTESGFKLFKDVNIAVDKFLSIVPETGNYEWVMAIDSISKYYEGDMHYYGNGQDSLNMLVTPDHPMFWYKNSTNEIKIPQFTSQKEALKLHPSRRLLKLAGTPASKEYVDTIDIAGKSYNTKLFLRFLAYYLADGSIANDAVHIAQHQNSKHRLAIESDLKALFTPEDITVSDCTSHGIKTGFYIFSKFLTKYLKVFGLCNAKFVPDFVFNLSSEAITEFLKAYSITDGSTNTSYIDGKGYDKLSFFTTSIKMRDDLCLLLQLVGKGSSFSMPIPKGTTNFIKGIPYVSNHDLYVIRVLRRNWKRIPEPKVVKYSGYVYDVTLEKNSTLLVERNGRIVWGSNCPVCRVQHGRVFQVSDARSNLQKVLQLKDPDKIKEYAPWPNVKEAQNISRMSADEIVIAGWQHPPWHSACRCLIVKIKDVPHLSMEAKPSSVASGANYQRYVPNKWDFVSTGLDESEQNLIAWNKAFNISPMQLLSRLFGEPAGLMTRDYLGTRGFMAKLNHRDLQFEVNKSIFGSTHPVGFKGSISLETKSAVLDMLEFADVDAAKGVEVLGSSIKGFKDAGIEVVNINANVGQGSFALARLGWHPRTPAEWASLKENYILESWAKMKTEVPDMVRKSVDSILASKDPQAIWDLSDIGYQVKGKGLGQALLEDTQWWGELDLTDPHAMQRYNTFMG